MKNRMHNLSMFILCISAVITLTFISCNDKSKSEQLPESTIDYSKFITQTVEYNYTYKVYTLTTTGTYQYGIYQNKIIYFEIDEFTNEEQLKEFKIKRFNEAKVIIDNLIKFNE